MKQSMLSIKRMNQTTANELYILGKKKYDSFYDVMIALSNSKLKSDQMEILININYFQDFAGEKKIKRYVEYFNALYGAKQFNKNKQYVVSLDFLKKYCEEKPATYANFDSESALKDLWNMLADKEYSQIDKVKFELEYLGYAQTMIPELSESYGIITAMEQNYSNKMISVHRLSTGLIDKYKVRGKAYENNPFEIGDVIVTTEITEEYKKRQVNGKWINSTDTEFILKKWDKVTK